MAVSTSPREGRRGRDRPGRRRPAFRDPGHRESRRGHRPRGRGRFRGHRRDHRSGAGPSPRRSNRERRRSRPRARRVWMVRTDSPVGRRPPRSSGLPGRKGQSACGSVPGAGRVPRGPRARARAGRRVGREFGRSPFSGASACGVGVRPCGDAAGDAVEPGGERVGRSDRAGRAGEDQERRLGGILGLVVVAGDLPAGAPDHRPVPLDEGRERRLGDVRRTAEEALEQGTVREAGGRPDPEQSLELRLRTRQWTPRPRTRPPVFVSRTLYKSASRRVGMLQVSYD